MKRKRELGFRKQNMDKSIKILFIYNKRKKKESSLMTMRVYFLKRVRVHYSIKK